MKHCFLEILNFSKCPHYIFGCAVVEMYLNQPETSDEHQLFYMCNFNVKSYNLITRGQNI